MHFSEASGSPDTAAACLYLPVLERRQPRPQGMRSMERQKTTPERPVTPPMDPQSQNGQRPPLVHSLLPTQNMCTRFSNN